MDFLSALIAQNEPSGWVQTVDRLARAPLSKIVLFAAVLTVLRVLIHPYIAKTPIHKQLGAYGIAKFFNEMADAVIYAAIVVFMLVRPFGIQTFFIPSPSMVDTLRLQDYIVANKFVYRVSQPKDGDIVVFRPPSAAVRPTDPDTDFIKRLIGCPGDVIEVKNKVVYRNGQPLDEPYVDYTDEFTQWQTPLPKERWKDISMPDWKLVEYKGQPFPCSVQGSLVNAPGSTTASQYIVGDPIEMRKLLDAKPIAIPDGYYLFMGDNRNGSFDGRFWGLVPRASIVGKAWFIWMPISRIRGL